MTKRRPFNQLANVLPQLPRQLPRHQILKPFRAHAPNRAWTLPPSFVNKSA
jgi:hypothetical protein